MSALQERDEALCGTGFFTNIAQYRCTDIGDISDEGKSKGLSSSQEGAVDSLMSKFNMDDSVIVDASSSDDSAKTAGSKEKDKTNGPQ